MCLTPDDYADDLRPPTAVGPRHRRANVAQFKTGDVAWLTRYVFGWFRLKGVKVRGARVVSASDDTIAIQWLDDGCAQADGIVFVSPSIVFESSTKAAEQAKLLAAEHEVKFLKR